MTTYIINGSVLTPNEHLEGATIAIDNGVITEISTGQAPGRSGDTIIDAQGKIVTPGLIDVHFHGAMGVDTMDADPCSLEIMAQFCLKHGVTAFYPTTWSAAAEDIFAAIDAVKRYMGRFKGAQLLGVHIEGPYLDMDYRGAQLPSMIRVPDPKEYDQWFESGVVKLVTCAPEVPQGYAFIQAAVRNNIRISIGHTQASYEEVIKAADCGASQATHIFNGMPGLHHREPRTVGGVFSEPRIAAQMICDGVHLHPSIVDLVVKAKTPERVILITDSIRGTGLADGDYDFKGQKFSVRSGVARTPAGGLSGSTLTLDQALRNCLRFTSRPITEILPMATSIPAQAMGLDGQKGVIQRGADADLVLFEPDFTVHSVWVKGEQLYSK